MTAATTALAPRSTLRLTFATARLVDDARRDLLLAALVPTGSLDGAQHLLVLALSLRLLHPAWWHGDGSPRCEAELPRRLQAAAQREHEHHDEDEADQAARIVAPAAAVRPRRECADGQQNQYDDQQRDHVDVPPEDMSFRGHR